MKPRSPISIPQSSHVHTNINVKEKANVSAFQFKLPLKTAFLHIVIMVIKLQYNKKVLELRVKS